MYTLVRARYRASRRGGRWTEANLANVPASTLSTNYGDIYLYITYPGPGGVITKALRWVNVQTWLNTISPTLTVQQWLTAQGNKTLPFDATLPKETVRYVRYAQAWHCGYHAEPIARNGAVDQEISKFAKEDLLLTHPTHKPQTIRDYSMISVNGFFHLCDWTTAGVRVLGGNSTMRKSNDNQIGIYSFETIGKLTFVPITANMIQPQSDTTPLWDGAYITLPTTVNLTNKTVLLVTGGYLNVLSNVYNRTGDRTWKVNFGKMMFLDRYIESVQSMDLSSLGLTIDEDNPTLFSLAELKHDSVIKAYLTLPQSFFVIVDSTSFFQEFQPAEYLDLPGRFIDAKAERFPLVGAYGRMLDYHVIKEPGKSGRTADYERLYVYCATENKRYDYDANHRNWPSMPVVDGGRYPARPWRHETAYFRILGVEG